MCMVAPRGSTMSVTSLEMPVSAAASILVGMVAHGRAGAQRDDGGLGNVGEHGFDRAFSASKPGK